MKNRLKVKIRHNHKGYAIFKDGKRISGYYIRKQDATEKFSFLISR